jgi:signal transduction histidine kinase
VSLANLADAAQLPNRQQGGVIVIVDDEMMVTSSLQTMLQLQTPHRIYCFNHPQEALTQLLHLQPELVISDFSMPGMDGIQFLKQVREQLPEATLMLLTGYADKESAIAAINTVGIYRYLEKPWDNNDLKISIANGLERSRLVGDLRRTITELTATQEKLAEANQHLESLVTMRTQALQGAYQTLSSIVNNTTDGIVTLDATLRLQSFNPAVERWFRQVGSLRQANLTELELEQWLHSEKSGVLVRQYFESGHACRVDDLRLGDLPVEASISPLHNRESLDSDVDEGPPRGFVLVLRDITARREVERLRDDFVSTLTHDLRTPLLAAIQTLGFFADGTLGTLAQRQKDLVTMLISSHKELLELVNVLLDVYRYEAGNQQLLMDKVNPWTLLTLTVKELSALAQSREQSLIVDSPHSTLHSLETLAIQGDKRELKRVLINLLGNAIHYTPRGGRISADLELSDDDQRVKITVKDNGRGIPSSDLPLLFQRFSQGTSRQRSSGSGLGLYLSRQIVEAHQGRIWVESEENVGSRFYVELPLMAIRKPA